MKWMENWFCRFEDTRNRVQWITSCWAAKRLFAFNTGSVLRTPTAEIPFNIILRREEMKKSCILHSQNIKKLLCEKKNMYGDVVDKVAVESNQPIKGNDEVARNIIVKNSFTCVILNTCWTNNFFTGIRVRI